MKELSIQSKSLIDTAKSFEEVERICNMLADSTIVPESFRGKPADIFTAMEYSRQLDFPLLPLMNGMTFVNGRGGLMGDVALAIVRMHPDFISINETFTETDKVATCTITRNGNPPQTITRTFSWADAARAGLLDGKNSHSYKKYPQRMLRYRALGFAIRDLFSDALCGLHLKEEIEEVIPKEKDITNYSTRSERLANILAPEPETIVEEYNEECRHEVTEVNAGL